MEMRLVEKAKFSPGKCIVTGDIDGPFIDTGVWARQHDPYVYIHAPTVEYMARELLGMVPRAEVDALREQVQAYEARLEQLERFVTAHEAFAEAVQEVAA